MFPAKYCRKYMANNDIGRQAWKHVNNCWQSTAINVDSRKSYKCFLQYFWVLLKEHYLFSTFVSMITFCTESLTCSDPLNLLIY